MYRLQDTRQNALSLLILHAMVITRSTRRISYVLSTSPNRFMNAIENLFPYTSNSITISLKKFKSNSLTRGKIPMQGI